jgi:Holliday junction resolvasome RuvABC endonuclease subunit
MKICGIDYSTTCPAISVGTYEGKKLVDLKQYFATYKKSDIKDHPVVKPTLLVEKANVNQTLRYAEIAEWAANIAQGCDFAMIEDYAFAAKGRVFHIGENTGLLKYMLTLKGVKFDAVNPKVVKAFATGTGNADKDLMYSAYTKATGIDLSPWVGKKKSVGSPVSDVSDSYWIMAVAFQHTMT